MERNEDAWIIRTAFQTSDAEFFGQYDHEWEQWRQQVRIVDVVGLRLYHDDSITAITIVHSTIFFCLAIVIAVMESS